MTTESEAPRPRRTILFLPASNPRAIEKARGLACDGVVLDLEDAVAEEAKDTARQAAAEAIVAGFGGREVILRCNGLDTPWGAADLEAAAAAGPDGVLIPKPRAARDIEACEALLASAPARTRLWAMIETAEAVLNLREIAEASRRTRLTALVLGPNDLSADLRLRPSAGHAPLEPILSALVVAARAYGLVALGGAFNAFEDVQGLEADCRRDAAFGFDGKTLIHPGQIDIANRIFSPSPEEVAWARTVVKAFAAPEAVAKGAIRVEGRMVERLHLQDARRVIRR